MDLLVILVSVVRPENEAHPVKLVQLVYQARLDLPETKDQLENPGPGVHEDLWDLLVSRVRRAVKESQ